MCCLYVYIQQAEEIHVLNQRIALLNSDVELARSQLQATTDKLEQTNQQLADVRYALIFYNINHSCCR